MIIIRSKAHLRLLQANTALYHHLQRRLHEAGEGCFVLIEDNDLCITLPELQADLRTLSFDGVFRSAGTFHAVYLTNNEYAVEFLFPDTADLDGAIRGNLERHL